MLREQRRRRAGEPREHEAPSPVQLPDAAAEGAGRELAEVAPQRRERRVVGGLLPCSLELTRRVQVCTRLRCPGRRVARALEVEGGESVRAVGEVLRGAQHAVVDAEHARELADARRDLVGERAQHERVQQHHVHHPGAEGEVAPRHGLAVLGSRDRGERVVVDRVRGHRLGDRVEQRMLHRGEHAVRGRHAHHATAHDLDLGVVGWLEPDRLVVGQRDRCDCAHVAHRQRGALGIPSPIIAMMSRWTSFVPPPNVKIVFARYARSSLPASMAPVVPSSR